VAKTARKPSPLALLKYSLGGCTIDMPRRTPMGRSTDSPRDTLFNVCKPSFLSVLTVYYTNFLATFKTFILPIITGHYLAHLACLPGGLYVLTSANFFLFLYVHLESWRPIISRYIGPILTTFSPDGRYRIVDK